MPQWSVQYNLREYFCNVWPKTQYAFAGVGNLLQEKNFRAFSMENSPPRRNSKNNVGQEGRPGIPKSRVICGRNIPKFATCKHGSNLFRDGVNVILHIRSPSGALGRKAWQKNMGWRQQLQARGGKPRTLKHLTNVSSYAPNIWFSGWPYRIIR